jgi:hypothetical protein
VSPTDLLLDLDCEARWTLEQKQDLWEWIAKNLDDRIELAENGYPTMLKFLRFCPHNHDQNIGLSDKDQELFDKLKLPDFIGKETSKSPTPPPNPSSSSIHYKKPALEIPLVDID